ncbi:hypothetical protein AB0L65_53545, partial [Nonomuraea sp. NPDC052116]
GRQIATLDTIVEVHDLHIWEVTSGYAALSAHILVTPGADCHAARLAIEELLRHSHGIEHTTLQVDHATPDSHTFDDNGTPRPLEPHCADPHGPTHHAQPRDEMTVSDNHAAPRTSAPTAPQCECPHTTMSQTPSTSTAYSTVAASPDECPGR